MRSSATFTLVTLASLVLFVGGCAGPVETADSDASPAAESDTGPTIPGSMMPGIPGAGQTPGGEQPPAPNYPSVQPPATTPPAFDPNLPEGSGGQRFRAEAGVGKQGQSLQNEQGIGGMIVQPARSLFAVKQRVVFEVQIPKAMQLFNATEGRKPKSHDEYMTKIIKANLIKLPELPPGQTYYYDPQEGELMVHKKGG